MKLSLLLICVFLCVSFTNGQVKRQVLPGKTFDKMMVDYFNFSLLGTGTPSTGFKVETIKPAITLKGNILSNKSGNVITNLEITGGVDDGLMQIIAGRKGNTYFKGILGINILPRWNFARHFKISETEHLLNQRAYKANRRLLSLQLDTFLTIKVILDDSSFLKYDEMQFVSAVMALRSSQLKGIFNFNSVLVGSDGAYYRSLIQGLATFYSAVQPPATTTFLDFQRSISHGLNSNLQAKKILSDYDRLEAILYHNQKINIEDKQADFEIDLTKVLWTHKYIVWWNASITSSNTNFKMYDKVTEKLASDNSFLNGLSVSLNYLDKGKAANQFTFLKGGVTLQRVNNLEELNDFVYKKETTITVNPGETLKSSEEGIAYEGNIEHEVGVDLFVEGYCVPCIKNFVPGFYVKCAYKNSSAWINKNKVQLDLGIVWNLTNDDKDAKNILSVVPYVSWASIVRHYKDDLKIEKSRLSDLFKFGVKLAVPVNLGK